MKNKCIDPGPFYDFVHSDTFMAYKIIMFILMLTMGLVIIGIVAHRAWKFSIKISLITQGLLLCGLYSIGLYWKKLTRRSNTELKNKQNKK